MGLFFRRRDRSKRTGRRGGRFAPSLRSERLETRYALAIDSVGDLELLNDIVAGDQTIETSSMAVAANDTGRIVVWSGDGPGDSQGIYARRFGADGAALGDSFLVNTTIQGDQDAPAVAMATDGSFVVVWSGRGVADKQGVFLQRYDADGSAIGTEITVNNTLGGSQSSPTVAYGTGELFVVAWEGAGDGDAAGVFFRRFNADGAIGLEARANTTTADDQEGVALTFLQDNNFLVGWQSRHQDGSDWGVYAQSFNSLGLPVGEETRLNGTTAGSQTDLTLAADPTGGYVAAWQSFGQDADGWSIVARDVNADGELADTETVINDQTAGHQLAPALDVAIDGQWLLAWVGHAASEAGWQVFTRAIEASGASGASAAATEVATGPSADTINPTVVLIDEEEALLVRSGSGEGDGAGVLAQRYTVTLADDGDPTAPAITPVDDFQTEVGTPVELTVTATDVNSRDTLTFTLEVVDSGADATIEQIDNNTAIIRWTAADEDSGQTIGFRLVVTDDSADAFVSTEEFSATVTDIPLAVDLNGSADGVEAAQDFIVGDIALQAIAPDLEIGGADLGMVSGATVTLLDAPDGDAELLSVSTNGVAAITAEYDSTTRILTLTGEATVADYEAVLRTLVYNNSTDHPSGQREISVSVTDAEGESPVALATVTIVQPDLVAFAEALADAGVEFFGAVWDEASTEQRQLFQDGADQLPFTDVTNPDRSFNQAATDNSIETLPTWVFQDSTRATGLQSLAALSAFSGIDIPTSTAPQIAAIADTELLVGSPKFIALDGYDPNGGELTYTVSSDNADVTASIVTGNRSIRVSTRNDVDASGGDYGDMVFMLFESEAPLATGRVIELAEDGFYDDLAFHRVLDGFAVQGGSPNGDGVGGSTLPDFDDEFHPDLQHNQAGLLSLAKSSDDTNNSQFFITDGENTSTLRNLDFNHTVFGLLVEGGSTLDAVSSVAVQQAQNSSEISSPVNPIRMDTVEVFNDTENGVLMLEAADGATGTANITVTVTDASGATTDITFSVDLEDDTVNGRPYLGPVPDVGPVTEDSVSFQLTSVDVEGDDVQYSVRTTTNATATVDDAGSSPSTWRMTSLARSPLRSVCTGRNTTSPTPTSSVTATSRPSRSSSFSKRR